jgi:hypothetical protein
MKKAIDRHLNQNRSSDKFRGFSYRKIFVDSVKTNGYSKVISWDVYYSDTKLVTLPTLKQVKYYIGTKVTKL